MGPAFVRTPRLHDARYEEILKESGALERETAAIRRGIRETKQQIDELVKRSVHVGRELERTDRAITTAAEEMAAVDAELAAARRERQVVAERLSAVEAMAATIRRQLAATPQVITEPPALPPAAEAPIRLRVDVESLRLFVEGVAEQGGALGVKQRPLAVDVATAFLARGEPEFAEEQGAGAKEFEKPCSLRRPNRKAVCPCRSCARKNSTPCSTSGAGNGRWHSHRMNDDREARGGTTGVPI